MTSGAAVILHTVVMRTAMVMVRVVVAATVNSTVNSGGQR